MLLTESLCTGFLNWTHFSSTKPGFERFKTYEPAFWQQLIFKLDTTCSSNKHSNYTLSEIAHKCILEYATKCTNTRHQKAIALLTIGVEIWGPCKITTDRLVIICVTSPISRKLSYLKGKKIAHIRLGNTSNFQSFNVHQVWHHPGRFSCHSVKLS